MSTTSDPLSNGPLPDRLAYRLGTMLNAEDLEAEQTYHRSRLARVLAFLHGSGTAAGLAVGIEGTPTDPTTGVEPPSPEEVRVQAGLAVDRLGRLIEVPRAACIRVQRWFDALPGDQLSLAAAGGASILVDVFLRYAACPRGLTPAFSTGPADALNATAPSRIRDGYELKLALRTETVPPVPADPFINLQNVSVAERRNRVERALLDAWEASERVDTSVPIGLDRSLYWVLLSRVRIPVDSSGASPRRTLAPCVIDSTVHRPLVYPTAALVGLLGL